MNVKLLSLVAAGALAIAPVGAAQASSSEGEQAKEKTSQKRSQNRKQKRGGSKRCAKLDRVGFLVQGSLASYDDASVSLDVARTNRHAAKWLAAANAPTFETAGVRLAFEGVADANGTGVGLDDVLPTDRVRVVGKLLQPKKRCAGGEMQLKLRAVKVTREVDEPDETPAA